MIHLTRILLVVGTALFVIGCSSSDDETADSLAEDISEEEAIKELKDETGIDVEAIEEEMGIDKSDSASIPADIPNDVPLPDDMEVDFTIENELMAQAWLLTKLSREELIDMYENYLNSNFAGEVKSEDHEMNGYYTITYIVPYKDTGFSIQIIDDEDDSERTISLSISDLLIE